MSEVTPIRFVMPMKTQLENVRRRVASMGALMAATVRARAQKEQTLVHMIAALRKSGRKASDYLPALVTLTRVSAGSPDSDGTVGALKYVRDAVAKALGADDGDEAAIQFRYEQRKGARGHYAVEVAVERKVPTTLQSLCRSQLHKLTRIDELLRELQDNPDLRELLLIPKSDYSFANIRKLVAEALVDVMAEAL